MSLSMRRSVNRKNRILISEDVTKQTVAPRIHSAQRDGEFSFRRVETPG